MAPRVLNKLAAAAAGVIFATNDYGLGTATAALLSRRNRESNMQPPCSAKKGSSGSPGLKRKKGSIKKKVPGAAAFFAAFST